MIRLVGPIVVMILIASAVAALAAPRPSDPISALIGAVFDRPGAAPPVVAQDARLRRRHHLPRSRPPRRPAAPAVIASDPADANATALLIEPRVEIVRVRVNHPEREAVPVYWPGMMREIAATSRQIEMQPPQEPPASPSQAPAIVWMVLTIIAIGLVLLTTRRLRRDPLRQAARNVVDDLRLAAMETPEWLRERRQEAADRLRAIGVVGSARVLLRDLRRRA